MRPLFVFTNLSPLLSVRQAPAGNDSGQNLTRARDRNRTTDLLLYLSSDVITCHGLVISHLVGTITTQSFLQEPKYTSSLITSAVHRAPRPLDLRW